MQTDIEVLKTEMRGLQTAISEVGSKMDMLLGMQVQIVRLQEQHDSTKQSVDRAFSSIRDMGGRVQTTESTVHKVLSFVKGGALVGALLFGFAQWYVMQQLAAINRIDADLSVIDRRMIAVEAKIWPDTIGGRK